MQKIKYTIKKAPMGKHIAGLDGLRGIAVTGVILYHFFPNAVRGGFLGVSLFFVLSGYLIAVTSECDWMTKQFHVLRFYKKRIKKIYPSLLIVVFITAGLLKIFSPNILNGIKDEIYSILLGYNNFWQIIQNSSYFTKIINTSPFTHLWSLSIELQFYLIWPFLFFIYKYLRRSNFSRYRGWLFVGPAIISVLVLQFTFHPGHDVTQVYYGTVTRMFSLFMGAFIGVNQATRKSGILSRHKKQKIFYLFVFLMFLLILSFALVDGQADSTYRIGLLATSFLFCGILKLVANTQLPIGRMLDCKPLSWIGKRSYEIYLWQYPVIFIFQYQKWDRIILSPVIMCIIILLLSIWIHELLKIRIGFGGTKMKHTKSPFFRIVTVLCATVFILGGCSVINSPGAKKDSQKQLQTELKKNSERLKKQQQTHKDRKSKDFATAIGDSVILGAVPSIQKAIPTCIIDAKESRQVSQAEKVAGSLDKQGKLGNTVIIALGTNGTFNEATGQSLIDMLGKDRNIYWVTVYGNHISWQDAANRAIDAVAEKNDNVHIIDWAGEAANHKEWFYDDGVHLNVNGQKAYADLILRSIII